MNYVLIALNRSMKQLMLSIILIDLSANTVPEVLNDFARELKRLQIDLPVTARPLTFGTLDWWRPRR